MQLIDHNKSEAISTFRSLSQIDRPDVNVDLFNFSNDLRLNLANAPFFSGNRGPTSTQQRQIPAINKIKWHNSRRRY